MENETKTSITNIFKGVGISLGVTGIFLLIFSIILTYTDAKEEWIVPVIIVLTGISILIGSSLANLKLRKNGMINGLAIGGIYLIILYFISSLTMMKFEVNIESVIIIIVGSIFGMLGGIIGVNKK